MMNLVMVSEDLDKIDSLTVGGSDHEAVWLRTLTNMEEQVLDPENVPITVFELEMVDSVIVALEEVVETILLPITTSDLLNFEITTLEMTRYKCTILIFLSGYQQFKFVLVWTFGGFWMILFPMFPDSPMKLMGIIDFIVTKNLSTFSIGTFGHGPEQMFSSNFTSRRNVTEDKFSWIWVMSLDPMFQNHS